MNKTKTQKILILAYDKGYRCDKNGNLYSFTGQRLNPYIDKGYYKFSIKLNLDLHHKIISRSVPVHRLQAFQKFGSDIFSPNILVRHLNGNSLDNSWNNLELGSAQDNSLDIPEEKRLELAIKASSKLRRFSDLELEDIRNFYNENKSYKKTMDKFQISSKGSLSYMLKTSYKTNK